MRVNGVKSLCKQQVVAVAGVAVPCCHHAGRELSSLSISQSASPCQQLASVLSQEAIARQKGKEQADLCLLLRKLLKMEK